MTKIKHDPVHRVSVCLVGCLVGWFGLFVVFLLSSFLIVFCVLFVFFVFLFFFRLQTTDFPWLVVGYAVGLMLAFLANYYGITINGVRGQPALLYLVPCTLGVYIGMAKWKGEFEELWNEVETGEEAEEDDAHEEEERGGQHMENGGGGAGKKDAGGGGSGTSERDLQFEEEVTEGDNSDKTSLLA